MPTFPVTPDPSKVLLIDTSKWQDDPTTIQNIDFEKMKSLGSSGVIMKVGQGLTKDRNYDTALTNALLSDIPVGGYWFYDNRVEPKRQAMNFASWALPSLLKLGLWLDLEDRQAGSYAGWNNWYIFLSKLRELCPDALIGIYTGHYYWIEYTVQAGIPSPSLIYFKRYPLWIADYDSAPLYTIPWENDWTIHQFTDLLDGIKYGAESKELDGNYFNGTLDEYHTFFKLGDYVPPIDPPEEPMAEAKYDCVARYKAKVRPVPNTNNSTSEYVLQNEHFQISEIVPDSLDPTNAAKKWGHIYGGIHHDKYTALEYPGNDNPISTYTLIVVNPPPEKVLTHTITVYSDGSIQIDGQPYP